MKYTMPAAFSLPQNELETILRSGGGKQHSRKRIFAKYTEGRNAEQMVDFLKNEYGQTGKGFEINGNPVSVWFDEHGMSVGYGTQARETPIVTMELGRCGEPYPFHDRKWYLYECQLSISCRYTGAEPCCQPDLFLSAGWHG